MKLDFNSNSFRSVQSPLLVRKNMLKRVGVDGYIEIASEIEKRVNFSWIKHSFFAKSIFFFMEGKHFSNKQIMISVSSDVGDFAFKGNIRFFNNRRIYDF